MVRINPFEVITKRYWPITTILLKNGMVVIDQWCLSRIRLEIKIETGLKFDQSEQSLLNSKLVFFIIIGQISIQF